MRRHKASQRKVSRIVRLSAVASVTVLGACALPEVRPPAPPAPLEAELAEPPAEPEPALLPANSSKPRTARRHASKAATRSDSGTRAAASQASDDNDDIADVEPRLERLSPGANRPYTLMGVRYQPMAQVVPFHQRGTASWYGRDFHGRSTANGERYDMNQMTAAHPTLPIPSYARIRVLGNGHSVIVRINDRGPFMAGRSIDLSYAAATRLGIVGRGTAQVEIDAIVPAATGVMATASLISVH